MEITIQYQQYEGKDNRWFFYNDSNYHRNSRSNNYWNMKTAEEVYLEVTGCLLFTNDKPDIKKAMIEFARIHVEAALKAADKKAEYEFEEECWFDIDDKDFVLKSYPKENIK